MITKRQLQAKYLISGHIELLSGMRIGGSATPMSIGLPDLTVIRNPLDQKPYIPGSSLKGKMRSLIEQNNGWIGKSKGSNIQNGPYDLADQPISRLFGFVNMNSEENETAASRLIVRDCPLINSEKFHHTDLLYTESKVEVVIDRVTSQANPRTMERVPRGAIFSTEFVLNIFEGDNLEESLNLIKEGMRLLENDYLGSSGSRGYGQMEFKNVRIQRRAASYYKEGQSPEESQTFSWHI